MASLTLEIVIDPQPKADNIDPCTAVPEGYWFTPLEEDHPHYSDVDYWDLRFPPDPRMKPVRNKNGFWVWQSQMTIGAKL